MHHQKQDLNMQIQGQVLEQEVPKNKPNLQMNINGWELAPGQL